MRLSHLCLSAGALSLFATASAATVAPPAEPQTQAAIWLSSERTAADVAARNGMAMPEICSQRSNQTAGFAGILAFAFNFLFTEALEAISRAELARVKSLTDEFGALRNFASFAPEATATQRDCLVVEQRASIASDSDVHSVFIFAIEPVGDTGIALQPVMARVNATPVNRRARNPNVNVQLALSFGALVGGNCPSDEANCAAAELTTLGNPQFNFTNLVPGQSFVCEAQAGRQTGCDNMSGVSAAIPIARANTPTTIGAAVTVTSVTLANAKARQDMWERHRAALLDALNGVVSGATD